MCVVSNITDYHQRLYPNPWKAPYPKDIIDLIEKARKYDEITGQKDCPSEDKKEYIEALEKRVKELEKKMNE